jgi:hypothetical protein
MQYHYGKREVIDCISKLNGTNPNFSNYFGLVDKDFDEILNEVVQIPNLIYTENHDLEIDIIHSGALKRLLDVYSDENKMLKILGVNTRLEAFNLVLEIIIEQAVGIGILRLGCLQLGIPIDDSRIKRFCFSDFTFKISDLLDYVEGISGNMKLRPTVQNLSKMNYPKLQLTNGHDAMEIFSAGFQRFCKRFLRGANSKRIEHLLIGCFGSDYFRNTEIHNRIRNWESINGKDILL